MGRKLSPEDIEKTTIVEGWVWPLKDVKCWPWLQREKDLPNLISNHCAEKRVIVEAGGNAGFYVKSYANLFEQVYTFEPDHLNFKCLVENITEKNVIKIQSCIGYNRELVNITTSKGNIGCYHVSMNQEARKFIPMLQIDDLGLNVCDLIHLDIEGFEFDALLGAEKTINRTKPVIALEWLNHGSKFGNDNSKIESWLNERNYFSVEEIYHENVFVYKK